VVVLWVQVVVLWVQVVALWDQVVVLWVAYIAAKEAAYIAAKQAAYIVVKQVELGVFGVDPSEAFEVNNLVLLVVHTDLLVVIQNQGLRIQHQERSLLAYLTVVVFQV
tara:strand:- start:153 stop:476 length:324 start_codon:yes stop_codon:yes gene_type:complete